MRIILVIFVLALPVGGLGRLCSSGARVGSRVGSGAARAGRVVRSTPSVPRRLAGGGALGASDDVGRAGGKARSSGGSVLKEGAGNADNLLELGSGSDDDDRERSRGRRR
jgi:hypothetical protein